MKSVNWRVQLWRVAVFASVVGMFVLCAGAPQGYGG